MMSRLLGKIFRGTCAVAFAVVVLPILCCLEPFRRIRVGVLVEDRIGHLALNTGIFVRGMDIRGWPKRTTYIFLTRNPANRHLLTMWKRRLNIIESLWLRRASIGFLPILMRTRFYQPLPLHYNEHEEFSLASPSLSFTPEEERKGEALLAEMGVSKNDWFVVFHARDPAYLGKREGFGETVYRRRYRDCSVSNYLMAAKWIAEQGGYAIRLGSMVEQPLPDCGPRVIDYATRFRSDFMDIYLLAKCRFMLGNSSGPWVVSAIFNVPVATPNFSPYTTIGLGRDLLYLPMLLRCKKLGRILSFPEIVDRGLFNAPADLYTEQYYEDAGLEFLENEPEDILGITQDLMDRLEGRPPTPEQVELQQRYKAFYKGPNSGPLASNIGPRFAFRHRDLFSRPDEKADPVAVRNRAASA